MSDAQITELKKQRGNIKSQLTRFETFLNSINSNTDLEALDLETRYQKHAELWAKFERIQGQLESLTDQLEDSNHEEERYSFEERFYTASGKAKKHLKRLASVISNNTIESLSNPSPPEGNSNQREISNLMSSQFQLPKLQTPIFHGSFDTWLNFYDSFKSMCHDNPSIPPIQKFMYLKACVKNEAAEVIASLETSNDNYFVAWDLLKARFDNRKYIVESHVKALFDIPVISKDFSIQSLLDNIQKRIRALQALEQPVEHWDTLLIFIIKDKLNNYIRERWEESVGSTRVPSLKDMLDFLERRALLENTQSFHRYSNPYKSNTSKSGLPSRQNARTSQTCMTTAIDSKQSNSQLTCVLCSDKHALWACGKFLELSPQERYDFVKGSNICHNCFNKNHRTIDCRKKLCRKCHKRHNILLHFDKQAFEKTVESTSQATTSLVSLQSRAPSHVILGTAVIEILDSEGQYRSCRALLDSCSQCNSITERLASKLGLKRKKVDIKLKGVQNLETKIQFGTSTSIKSRINCVQFDVSFLEFREIASRTPSIPLNKHAFQIPEGIVLADPNFDKPSDVDVLIGAEYFYNLLGARKIHIKGQNAVLQESKFGWIIAGKYIDPHPSISEREMSCNVMKFQDLPLLWELGPESSSKIHSKEEQDCENHYIMNTKRSDTGRYIVKLPFNGKKELLGESRNPAFQRFYALERKLETNSVLKSQYLECMQSYLDENHMSLISDEFQGSHRGFYLPHHAVVKNCSLTTKTRVVFDGSAKTSSGISLNNTLMIGPTIQEDLFSIVLRFRTFQYALTADIQQMYRQVQVAPEDSFFQKIIWRSNPNEPIKIYSLNTVTFGTACAPFLAVRTLHRLADDESESHPIASPILKRDFYVDDLLTGAQTLQDAVDLRNDLIELLKKGGFNLRKWASNHEKLRNEFSTDVSSAHLSLDPTETIKALGLHWNSVTDSFLYTVNLSNSREKTTKRTILSQTAKLFDPLGLLGPVIVAVKIMIQQLWKSNLTWDDPVPEDIKLKWEEYKTQLSLLKNINFDRCIIIPEAVKLQLHGFCDASERAFGACFYLRSTNRQGKHRSSLVCSKSRVAPIKTTTLPRLELCAATLLVKLYNSVIKSFNFQFHEVYLWSDSTIVLNWINTPPNTLKTFIANRVAEIQTTTQPQQWRHVPTQDNPADHVSRGQSSQEFLQNDLWRHGPIWLCEDSKKWPQLEFKSREIPEKRTASPIISLQIMQMNKNLLEKYDDINKLLRVTAYCLRFFNNLKAKDKERQFQVPPSKNELTVALRVILKLTQVEAFPEEMHALSSNKEINTKSKLLRLNPFMDQGIIKVGGRLMHANIKETQKHPIVLPKGHPVTTLIIRDEHKKRLHAGVHTTLYGIRENYWIIDGRNAVRHILRQCIPCFRAKPPETFYLMGNLPKNRLSFTRPFINSGVDYCGPFYVKEHRHRNRTKVKTYVSVFVCLATKAIHLELVSDLTTESFIACLKRFIARRGKIESLASDNATNFTGANNELKKLCQCIETIEKDIKVQNYVSEKMINWHFIPPRAPHFGGLWEAGVKSFKFHFTRVAGASLLTYEQLQTYVVEIEAILNSRPLTPLSPDPTDFLPLTPGHFLIGSSMTSVPQEDLRTVPVNRLSNWQLAQQMRHHFWTRWHKEYLNELITRSKWQSATNQNNIKAGTLVVINEENVPPMNWKLGRIVDTHPGQDGIIRTVTLKCSSGLYKRSLKQLYPLPIDD